MNSPEMIPILVVALVAGICGALAAFQRPRLLLYSILLVVPFLEIVRRLLLAAGAQPLWSTLLSVLLLVLLLELLTISSIREGVKWRRTGKAPALHWVNGLFVGVVLWYGIQALTSPSRMAGLAAFRDYFQPALVFILAQLIRPSSRMMRRFLRLWIVAGLVILTVELLQAIGWTAETYRLLGFVRANGELVVPLLYYQGGTFLRPASTVSGPNELGMHMVLWTLLCVQLVVTREGRPRILAGAAAILFFLGMVVTYSRSAFLACIAGLLSTGALWLVRSRLRSTIRRFKPTRVVVLAVCIGLVALVAVSAATGMLGLMGQTIRSLSGEYHIQDTLDAARFLTAHPQGVGMGLVGPRDGAFFPELEVFHVEGSLLQLAGDAGIVGLALWLAFVLTTLWVAARRWLELRDPELRAVSATGITGWAGALVAFLFLPLMQADALMMWLWFLLGTALVAKEAEARD